MYDWKGIETKLRSCCEIDASTGHWVWNSAEIKVNSPIALRTYAKPDTPVAFHLPMAWLAMAQRGSYFINPQLRISKGCDEKNCLSHYVVSQVGVERVEDFEPDDYKENCIRFQSFCQISSEPKLTNNSKCILWTGFIHRGYGTIRFCGKSRKAHCVAWELAAMKSVPNGLIVRHLCDVTSCVNSDHLAIGTSKDNSDDELKAGKRRFGEKVPRASITDEIAKKIQLSLKEGTSSVVRAKRFGVKPWVVRQIDRGRTFTHLLSTKELNRRRRTLRRNMAKRKLSRDDIRKIKATEGKLTNKERAEKFDVPLNYIHQLNLKLINASVDPNKSQDRKNQEQTIKDKIEKAFERAKKTIEKRCTRWKDEKGVWHLLWDNKTDTKEPEHRPDTSFFGKIMGVHKVSYLAHNKLKEIPADRPIVRHLCIRKFCMLPGHLCAGTRAEDAQDRFRDGTVAATLTETQVKEILAAKNTCTQHEAAKRFKVSRSTVSQIWRGKTWKHITNTKNEEDDSDDDFFQNMDNQNMDNASQKDLFDDDDLMDDKEMPSPGSKRKSPDNGNDFNTVLRKLKEFDENRKRQKLT